MRLVVAVVMLTSVVLPVSAFADPGPATDVSKMVTDDCARARKAGKTCVLDVAAEEVGGTAPTAGEIGLRLLTFGKADSLIRVRRDFIPEIVKAAEDL
jgi:hypothetical protein